MLLSYSIPVLVFIAVAAADVLTTYMGLNLGAREVSAFADNDRPSILTNVLYKVGGAGLLLALYFGVLADHDVGSWFWWAIWLVGSAPGAWAVRNNFKVIRRLKG